MSQQVFCLFYIFFRFFAVGVFLFFVWRRYVLVIYVVLEVFFLRLVRWRSFFYFVYRFRVLVVDSVWGCFLEVLVLGRIRLFGYIFRGCLRFLGGEDKEMWFRGLGLGFREGRRIRLQLRFCGFYILRSFRRRAGITQFAIVGVVWFVLSNFSVFFCCLFFEIVLFFGFWFFSIWIRENV